MKKYFSYKQQKLHCESLNLEKLAKRYGTPFYVYSSQSLQIQFSRLAQEFANLDHLICFSVKANPNHAILKKFFRLGAGADVVSGGELTRALAAGCLPENIIFSGVGKTRDEITLAIKTGILQFNVESEQELELIAKIAGQLKCRACIAVRVNPDVDAKTHPYISTGLKENKFGVDAKLALALYQRAKIERWLDIAGIDCHIGSQITELAPYDAAFSQLRELILEIRKSGIHLKTVDLGGGLGIRYHDEKEINPKAYAQLVKKYFGDLGLRILLEPGRFLVGHAGALVTTVLFTKESSHGKYFTIVDAGFNDFKRPALYQAYHEIVPLRQTSKSRVVMDVVGPVCETTDIFARDRRIIPQKSGDILAILDVGAYGAAMACFYNSRPLPLEILVNGKTHRVVRQRITL